MASDRFKTALTAAAEDRVRVIRILEYSGPRSWVEATIAQAITERHNDGGPAWSIKGATLGSFPEILERAKVAAAPVLEEDPDPRPLATEAQVMEAPAETLTQETTDGYIRTSPSLEYPGHGYTVDPAIVVARNGYNFKVGDGVLLIGKPCTVYGFLLDSARNIAGMCPILVTDWEGYAGVTRVYAEHALEPARPAQTGENSEESAR